MTTTSATDRTAYLVLGMHRSGTSAVTQVLALAGASLPENVRLSYDGLRLEVAAPK